MTFGVLLIISLILLNTNSISKLKKYSMLISMTGIIILSLLLVYISFEPKNYYIGLVMTVVIGILTAFEKSAKYSDYQIWFLLLEIMIVGIGFYLNNQLR
mgnify:CR=1 FL=1